MCGFVIMTILFTAYNEGVEFVVRILFHRNQKVKQITNILDIGLQTIIISFTPPVKLVRVMPRNPTSAKFLCIDVERHSPVGATPA